MSGWTDEKRQAASDRIYKNQPWLKSTGPRTFEGKCESSQNSCKGGSNLRVRDLLKQVDRWIGHQKNEINQINIEISKVRK